MPVVDRQVNAHRSRSSDLADHSLDPGERFRWDDLMKRTCARIFATAAAVGLLTATATVAHAFQPGEYHSPESEGTAMRSPLVIAHRGASGYRPEHTLAAYELAVQYGADYIEPDLVSTKDGVLVDRHEPEISGTTDVAQRPEFAQRKKTVTIDGEKMTGWFTEDFTLAELKTLRAKERLPYRHRSARYNGRYQVPTYREVLELRARLSAKYKRSIGVIPEIKHSTYHRQIGLPLEKKVVAETTRFGLNRPGAPMWIQSFELTNLRDLKSKYGYRANTTFLTASKGGPADLAARGTTYAELLKPASLARLARSVDGISPEKVQIIPRTSAGTLGKPTSLVADAHKARLKVIPWTFRNENTFLPKEYRVGTKDSQYGRGRDEIVTYLKTGIDGFFTDQPDTGYQAREQLRRSKS